MNSSNSGCVGLSRASHTSDPWGRYYTLPIVSRSLIEQIEVPMPQLLLELGSGSGSLCKAAATRWHNARLITVDLDARANAGLMNNGQGIGSRHSHFIHDVLDLELSDRIGLDLGTVDVAVCNPPYIRPRWRSGFSEILEDAGLSGSLTTLHDAGADLLFLAQNLRLLRTNGKLGLILPDGLITAERFSAVRKTLLKQHLVELVVQLPRRVFKGTEAQTYLVVLSKNAGETSHVLLREMGLSGELSMPIRITQDEAVKRLDFNFHDRVSSLRGEVEANPRTSIREFLSDVLRGTVCSSSIRAFQSPVFHLTDFAKPCGEDAVRIVPRRFALGKRAAQRLAQSVKLALPGDILLARVGRSLETQVALVVHGPIVISDCVFALRAKPTQSERIYRFFESQAGRDTLASSAHGVAAKFLSKTNLLEIRL